MGNKGRSDGVSTFFAFLIGAVAGAAVGLLLAPAAGHETRKRIRDTSVKAKAGVEDVAQKTIKTAKESTHKYFDLGKEQVQNTAQNLKAAIEVGKKAYKDKKEEIDSDLSQTGRTSEPDRNDDTA